MKDAILEVKVNHIRKQIEMCKKLGIEVIIKVPTLLN